MRQRRFTKVPKKPQQERAWNKDSHGLYDFDSSADNYKNQQLYIDEPVSIYRNFEQIHSLFPTDSTILHEKKNKRPVDSRLSLIGSILIDTKQDRRVFKFQPEIKKEQSSCPHNFYEVHRENNLENAANTGCPLKPGTIIKFGRVEFIVIELKVNNEMSQIRQTNLYHEGNGVFEAQVSLHEENQINCKICCCSEQTQADPLISPCNCKGSCAKIHLGCLRQWITSKVKKDVGAVVSSYNFTKFECELCKQPFPRIVKIKQKSYEMMKITKPEKHPYIILESLTKSANEERCLHLIEGRQNFGIKIGRNFQSQIRITDISVSREHAQISFKDGNFTIRDRKSKFGTLIRLPENEVTLSNKNKYRIQLGRVLYEFQVRDDHEECDTE